MRATRLSSDFVRQRNVSWVQPRRSGGCLLRQLMLTNLMHTALSLFPPTEARSAAHGHTACKWAKLELKPRLDSHGQFLETIFTPPHDSLSPSIPSENLRECPAGQGRRSSRESQNAQQAWCEILPFWIALSNCNAPVSLPPLMVGHDKQRPMRKRQLTLAWQRV